MRGYSEADARRLVR
jgi:serine/threonine protein kinase